MRRGRVPARVGLPIASCIALVACLLQAPGRIVPETKLDLAVDPVRFMRAALHLWDSRAGFGQIQNQAVGYLFPMGPFFAAGKTARVPMWIVQRGWMALLLVVAFWGTLRLAEALGVGATSTRVVAAAIYALSPPMVVLVGYTSAGQLGAALLPWVVIPLVRGSRDGSPRRAAALSALAVTAMGAVNATTSLCVLPLPALWLLTRRRGERRRSLTRWWVLALLLGSIWWIGPLILPERYGLNFVPFTESASVTNATHSVTQVVRGTGYWLSSLFVNGPWLRSGWDLESMPLAIAATGLLAALGLYGLARRDMPERAWLALSAGLAVIVMAAAYGGSLGGPFAATLRSLLDGPASAFRNLDKVQPVLRLPLALGAAHALSRLRVPHVDRLTVAAVASLVVVAAAAPFVRGEAVADGSFAAIPAYWQAAASWLGQQGGGRTLVLPAEPFGDYTWGRPQDEVLQAVARTPWAARNLVPLGTPDLTHLVDAIGQRLEAARPIPGLSSVLSRMGVRYVLLANDVNRFHSSAPPPAQLDRALAGIEGIRLAASFGPLVDPGVTADRLLPRLKAAERRIASLQIYEVTKPAELATTYATAGSLSAAGGPESILQLADRGALDGRGVVLKGDDPAADLSTNVVSDAFRLRDTSFGSVRNNSSYALSPDEVAPGSSRAPRDWISRPDNRAVARTDGALSVDASSYGSASVVLPEDQPANAFDGDSATAWVEGAPSARRQWIEIRFPHAMETTSASIQLLHDHMWRPWVTRIRVSTANGSVERSLAPTERAQQVRLPKGRTQWLRVTILGVRGPDGGAGFREIDLPGVRVTRPLVVPRAESAAAPATLVFDRSMADPYDATRADEESRLQRLFTIPRPATFSLSGEVVPSPGEDLDRLIATAAPSALKVTTSSTWGALPSFSGANAADGDPTTVWLASPDDHHPVVDLSWGAPRVLDSVKISGAPRPALDVTRLQIVSPAGNRTVELDGAGTARFEPLTTDRLTVNVLDVSTPTGSVGLVTSPPVGWSEITFAGLADLKPAPPDRTAPFVMPCGAGPAIHIDGKSVATSVTGTREDLLDLTPLRLTACPDRTPLGAGVHRLTTDAAGPFRISALTLAPGALPPPGPPRSVSVTTWAPEKRTATVGPGAAGFLATSENFNPGWRARLDGKTLQALRLDGWRQGWQLPAGAGGVVTLSFVAGQYFRFSLALGAVAVLLLVALALRSGRRRVVPGDIVGAAIARPLAIIVTVGGAGLLGGPVAAMGAVLLLCLRAETLAWVAGGGFVASTVLVALRPGVFPSSHAGTYGFAAQACSVMAIAALLATMARHDVSDPVP